MHKASAVISIICRNFDISGAYDNFQDIFRMGHLKLSQPLENSVCYCYKSYKMTDQFFMISESNEQLQKELEYIILKPDCYSW